MIRAMGLFTLKRERERERDTYIYIYTHAEMFFVTTLG